MLCFWGENTYPVGACFCLLSREVLLLKFLRIFTVYSYVNFYCFCQKLWCWLKFYGFRAFTTLISLISAYLESWKIRIPVNNYLCLRLVWNFLYIFLSIKDVLPFSAKKIRKQLLFPTSDSFLAFWQQFCKTEVFYSHFLALILSRIDITLI